MFSFVGFVWVGLLNSTPAVVTKAITEAVDNILAMKSSAEHQDVIAIILEGKEINLSEYC